MEKKNTRKEGKTLGGSEEGKENGEGGAKK